MSGFNYRDSDIRFYGSEEFLDFEVYPNRYGNLIKWESPESGSRIAIYRKGASQETWEILVTLDNHVTEFQDSKSQGEPFYDYQMFEIIEGDLMLAESHNSELLDFKLTEGLNSAHQDIQNRLRTHKTDWRSHPELGADLEQYEGESNTRKTGSLIERSALGSLTYDGRFREDDLDVRAVPQSIEHLNLYVMLDTDDTRPLIVQDEIEL